MPAVAARIAAIISAAIPARRRQVRRRRAESVAIWHGVELLRAPAAAAHAEYVTGARVGIEPDDAAVGRHPFDVIMRVSRFVWIGAFGVVERARIAMADLRQDAVERLHVLAV